MDRNTVLAITLCFLIYMGWQKLYLEPRVPPPSNSVTQISNPPANPGAIQGSSAETAAPVTEKAPKRPTVTMPLLTTTGPATLGDGADVFTGWNLNGYHTGLSTSSAAISLPFVTHQERELSLAFDDPAYAYLSDIQGSFRNTPEGIEWVYEDANVKLTRLISSADKQNYVSLQLNAHFKKKPPKYAFVSLEMPYASEDSDARDRELLYFSNGSLSRVSPKGASLKETVAPASYIGAESRYFLMAVLNGGTSAPNGLVQPLGPEKARASLVYPVNGDSFNVPLKVFFGPKDQELLRSVDPTLDHTINFGWFTVFAFPLLKILKFFYGFVGNYGYAIILLTLLLRAFTYPLTYKSMKNMREMAKIQPQLAKLREKYKNDKDSLNREMMALMKEHGYNPVAGCLPMIVQIPIFFALDRVLYCSIDLYHAPFALYIHDLSAKDPFYALPILLSLTMWFQMKISPTNATIDPAQQKIMQFMPLMFGAFMINLPSGLSLYILISTVAGIAQQLVLNKKFNTGPGSTRAPALATR